MEKLHSKKEVLGVLGVVVAIAAGATLPIVLSAAAGAHSSLSASPAVASCSPPGITGTGPGTTAPKANAPVADMSPPCVPALSAVPSTGLADGQTVSVTGTGFSADASVAVIECEPGATGADQCDLDTLDINQTNGSGDFSTPYSVTRDITVTGSNPEKPTEIDCAKSACFLGAADISDFSVSAFTALSFNPKLPLELTGTLDHQGTVRPRKGIAAISGTVTCNAPTSVDVEVDLTQYYHRFVFFNYEDTVVQCTTSPTTWTVDVPPGNGLYGVGKSMAEVYLSGQFGTSYRDVELTGNVRLAKK